jgi:acetyl-CoA C-acetyltransferase
LQRDCELLSRASTAGSPSATRHLSQAKDWKKRAEIAAQLPSHDVHLHLQSIKNRATGKSMGEHSEETAQEWGIGREEQDRVALLVSTCADGGVGSVALLEV